MQSKSFTQARLLGAVLKYDSNPNYTRGDGIFTNSGTTPIVLQPGVIFTGENSPSVFDTDDAAAFTGLCITTVTVDPGNSVPVAWIENGPAIVNINEVEFPADPAQRATLVTAMETAGFKLSAGLD